MWYESEKVQIKLEKWIGTQKVEMNPVELIVDWDLEDEAEGRVALNFYYRSGDFGTGSTKFIQDFYYLDFDERDIKMLEKAKSDLVARIKNVHNDVSMKLEIGDMMREAEKWSR